MGRLLRRGPPVEATMNEFFNSYPSAMQVEPQGEESDMTPPLLPPLPPPEPIPPLALGTGSGHFTVQPLLQNLPHGGKQTHKSYGFDLELDNQKVLNNMATVLGLSPNSIDALRGNFGRSKFDLTTNGNQLVKSRNRNWGGGATVYPLENVFLSGDYNQWGKENDPTKAYQVGVDYSGGDNGITAGLRGGQTFHADRFNKKGKPETNIYAEATVPLDLIPILGRILGYSP